MVLMYMHFEGQQDNVTVPGICLFLSYFTSQYRVDGISWTELVKCQVLSNDQNIAVYLFIHKLYTPYQIVLQDNHS